MIQVRKAADRGHADHGWLKTSHTFSFATYQDPAQMGFRALRVINEDHVQPGMGFGMHGHRNMEIVTYVLSGVLEHQDSLGNGAALRPGEFQRMTAGTGIRHSEFNPSATDPVHLYQIWLLPAQDGLQPGYEQKSFTDEAKRNSLCLVASPHGRDGSLTIHQEASVYLSLVDPGKSVTHTLAAGRHAWLQVLRGSVRVNGTLLQVSDGLAASDERDLVVAGETPAEIMLFDLA